MGLLHTSRISKCQKWCEINTILCESPLSFIRCPGIEKFVEKKKTKKNQKKLQEQQRKLAQRHFILRDSRVSAEYEMKYYFLFCFEEGEA